MARAVGVKVAAIDTGPPEEIDAVVPGDGFDVGARGHVGLARAPLIPMTETPTMMALAVAWFWAVADRVTFDDDFTSPSRWASVAPETVAVGSMAWS